MQKNKIYEGAIYYSQLSNKQLSLSLTRYFRDAFRDIFTKGQQVEADLKTIRTKFNPENDPKLVIETDKKKEFEDEVKALMDETIECAKLPADVYLKLESADIKVNKADLELIEALTE